MEVESDPAFLLGVLGGMGPLATVDFLAKLIAATPAGDDADHVPLVASSIPQIPSRVAAILAGGASPIRALLDARDRLLAAGATLLAMPCNTAHRWYDDLARGIAVPFLHIADAATDDVAARVPAGATVGDLFAIPGVSCVVGVGIGVGQGDHAVADVLAHADLPVGVGSVPVVLDVLVADVAEDAPAVAQVVGAAQVDVVAAVGFA